MVGIVDGKYFGFFVCNNNVTIRSERVVSVVSYSACKNILTELSKRTQPHEPPQ